MVKVIHLDEKTNSTFISVFSVQLEPAAGELAEAEHVVFTF